MIDKQRSGALQRTYEQTAGVTRVVPTCRGKQTCQLKKGQTVFELLKPNLGVKSQL